MIAQDGRSSIIGSSCSFRNPLLNRDHLVSTIVDKRQQPKGREGAPLLLNIVIGGLNLVKEASSIAPATTAVGVVVFLYHDPRKFLASFDSCPGLAHCQDAMVNDQDYVEAVLC